MRWTRQFFESLFSTHSGSCNLSHILSSINNCISEDDNCSLMKPYTMEKILVALKSIRPLKASGVDGFLAFFFQRCWHIVGEKVSKFILYVLNGNIDLALINVTNIVFIPKIQHHTKWLIFDLLASVM